MKKIISLIPLMVMGLICQPLAASAATESDTAALQQLEQLQMSMAKHTQDVAQADPRMDIFKSLTGAGNRGGAAPAAAAAPSAAPANPFAAASQMQQQQQQTAAAAANAANGPGPGVPGATQVGPVSADMPESNSSEAAEAMDEAAFRAVLRGITPFKADQVAKLKKAFLEDKLLTQGPVATPPKPVATTQFINLSPGATPPVVRLARGFVSSLVFIDSTGQPWNIESYDVGDPGSFNIQWDKKGNTLMIQATNFYRYGNMAVKLWDLNTPVMLTLVPGQKAVDYRIDFRLPLVGPMARPPVMTTVAANGANDELLSVLNGVPPADVMEVTVSGGQAQAWVRGTTMFVRTEAQMLSPGWLSTMRSADGMNAYELPVTPRLLMSVRGKIIQYKVEGL